MKRCFSRYRLALFALSIVSSTMFADQIWRGTSGGDVIDENLVIKDDVLLRLGGTRIEAIHKDVTVTVTRDVTISGHWAGESQLYLVAAEGRTIRFVGDHNITFIGSSEITGDALLTVQSGPGTVEVALAEGKTFEITSQNFSGGVQWYVLMYGGADAPVDEYFGDEYSNLPPRSCCEEYASGGLFNDEYSGDEYCSPGNGVNENSPFRPTLRFVSLTNLPRSSNQNRQVIVGEKSLMSFLSSRRVDVAQDSAFIQFDAAIDCCNRMILNVKDTGAFVAAGHYTYQRNGGCITLANINRAIAAGLDAVWSIYNGLGSDFAAGLLVVDENATLSELLADPFLDLDTRNDLAGYRGLFSGQRYGVVLGANGTLWVQANSYLDFVGLTLNQLPCVTVPGFENTNISKLLKVRNASAFIIDGNNNPNARPAHILFGTKAAVYLRSGIADNGVIRGIDDVDPFTIDSADRTRGVGNIVFDLEGQLRVDGSLVGDDPLTVSSKIELLSLEVIPTGGSLFVGSDETDFPLRTFNTEDGDLLQYNSGAFLINNMMSLYNTALSHTDVSHLIFQNNDLRSEPAYIGGETFKLLNSDVRPNISFLNSYLLVNADIALTGFDLVVPNLVDDQGIALDNLADFVFYANGVCIDNGTGRQMILGTRIGSTAADGCSRVDGEAYLDIMERYDAIASDFNPLNPNGNHTLILTTANNNASINNLIVDVLNNSIHTIFLGDSSNISIGVNADTTGFNIDTNPWLRIHGNVFSFQTRPGAVARSLTTGKNAIFVDLNGKISIDPGFIADFGVMVIKSHNGIVDLPADQVFFTNGAGIAIWNVDLSNLDDQIIIGPDQSLSTFIFNWILAKKDCPNFIPFSCCVDSCICPAVTESNVTGLPTIQGTIDDLQIQATRIGDPAQFLIDGGTVRQLTFSNNNCTAEAPVAVIVLANGGTVGLDGATTLGVNGITIIANGSGTVNINGDIVIDNTCSFVKGPDFAACDVLQLYSAVPRQILLKSSGTLNLSSFGVDEIVQIAGELRLVVEPGARIITGLGTLSFADNAQLLFVPSTRAFDFFNAIPFGLIDSTLPITTVDASLPHNALSSLTNFGAGLDNTDQFRVILAGQGTIEFRDNAQGLLPFNAFVGVETIDTTTCSILTTDLTIAIRDNGAFEIGRLNVNEGGVLQIGNVADLGETNSVSFTLTLDGNDANFSIGSRGFLGLGVGIERFDSQIQTLITRQGACDLSFIPNNNIVGTLSNVERITFNFLSGRFEHDRIFSGDDVNASLIAVGNNTGMEFDLNFAAPDENIDPALERTTTFNLAGGGNIVLVEVGTGGIQPVVLTQDGFITDRLSASIMASTLLETDNVDVAGLNGAAFFDYFKTHDAQLETARDNTFGRANAASQGDSFRPEFQSIRVDTVGLGVILRLSVFDIIGVGQNDSKRRNAIDTAAVFVEIDPVLNEIVTVTNIED